MYEDSTMRPILHRSLPLLLVAAAVLAQPQAQPLAARQTLAANGMLNAAPADGPSTDGPFLVRQERRDLCDLAIELTCDAVYSGSSANSQNGDTWQAYCFPGESGPEVIHRLEHPGGLLSLTLGSADSGQLDLILLGSCDPADCLAMPWLVGSDESVSGNYAAGTYYVVVDAYNWNGQPFSYTLDVQCIGEIDPCENALPLVCGETVFGSSAQAQSGNAWSSYCFSGESGPEVIYQLEHPGGFLSLELSSTDSEQLDLILLGSCDPADCLAMPWLVGSEESISGDYGAGTYFVVVDAFAWNGQPYTFELSASCPGEADLCEAALPLACGETVLGSSAQTQNGNLWSDYCHSGETGPEVIYAYEHPGGLLNLSLSSPDSGQLDLILLGSCDPDDCLAMPWLVGSSEIISGVWPAGTYFVVVDAFLWDGQPYTFELSTAPCLGTDALCHHESTGLSLVLPDPVGGAQRYYQLFNPEQDATLGSVLLHLDNAGGPQHEGNLTISIWEADEAAQPTIFAGSRVFNAGILADGWVELDLSPLGYQVQAFVDWFIGLEFAPAGENDRLGFFCGEPGGYEGFSSFFDGESYGNWWTDGVEFFDELNLCVRLSPPCPPVALSISMAGSDAQLSWEPTAGPLRIEVSGEGYSGWTQLATVDGILGGTSDPNVLTAGRRFYRGLRLCD
jgi:hypothetical protein